MVPVLGKPFLEYELKLLQFERNQTISFSAWVILGKAIQEYFGDGSRLGIKLEYSFDGDKPLGVAGSS